MHSSQVSSIDTVLALGARGLRVRVPSVPMLSWKLRVLEILLDKELTANRHNRNYGMHSSQFSSIDTALTLRARGLWVRVPLVPMLSWKLRVLEIPWDKELTANRHNRNHGMHSSQVSSIDTALTLGARGLWVRVPSVPMLSWKLRVLEIPWDKELTANCLVETRTKLEELIQAAMVAIWFKKGTTAPLRLQQSLMHGFSWFGLSWVTVVSEHL